MSLILWSVLIPGVKPLWYFEIFLCPYATVSRLLIIEASNALVIEGKTEINHKTPSL